MKEDRSDSYPLVSVVIPLYNRADYIETTIGSVLKQTYPNIEVIVVDDGSDDNGDDLVRKRFGDRIKVLSHPNRENRGQSCSLNLGIRHANGEFLSLLDSDDYFEEQKIALQVEYLEAHPEIGLVYGNGMAVDENGCKLYDIYQDDHQELNQPENILMDCYFLLPNNSMVRREVFDQAGEFDESLRAAQDHDMAIRIGEITDIAYIPDRIFCYRRHKDSISQKSAIRRWRNGFIILEKAAARYSYPRWALRKRRALLHFRLFQCHLEEGRPFSAIPHLLYAGLLDPVRSIGVMLGREKTSGLH